MVSEEKIFEIVDRRMTDDRRRTDDGRTPDHGHPISSPCEPNGSGELISTVVMDNFKDINCRIVNIHGHISCQTGVRVSIFRLCRYRDTVQVQKYICFQSIVLH